MNKVTVYQYDAFADTPNKGNPAGIVLDADHLLDHQMQEIAYKVGFNETVFVMKSNTADLRIRFFTPGHEINLCGHGTVAALYMLKSNGLLDKGDKITLETKAGILQINFIAKDEKLYVTMEHALPVFKPFQGSIKELSSSIGLSADDIDASMPTVYGSTGTWTLLVPIKTLEAFSRMVPQNKLFPNILEEMPHSSVHPFCLKTTNKHAHMHARHFSSPFSGTTEDPVTGTASGVMGAYYMTYLTPDVASLDLIVEQGEEINRGGEVHVHVTTYDHDIRVTTSGTAVYSGEASIVLE